MKYILFFAFTLLGIADAAEVSDLTLEPILKQREAAHFSAPSSEWTTFKESIDREALSHSPTLEDSLQTQFSLPQNSHARPGNLATALGFGRSSEETAVQAFGVPLNPAQGGGFDLSTFPLPMWSEAQYSSGADFSGADTRGVSGSLNLRPWTDAAMGHPKDGQRITALWSSQKVFTSSVGWAYDHSAFLVGSSFGKSSGGFEEGSVRFGSDDVKFRAHVLGADQKSDIPGSKSYPTPHASQSSRRIIPVVQLDELRVGHGLLSVSSFFDQNYIKYDDVDSGLRTRDHATQWGVQNGYQVGQSRVSASFRQTHFTQLTFDAPTENSGAVGFSHHLGDRTFEVEPHAELRSVSHFGIMPEGGVFFGREFSSVNRGYVKTGYAERIPSLVDRYYVLPGFFTGNPNLKTEKVLSAALGAVQKIDATVSQFEFFAQWRSDAIVSSGVVQPYNAGSAHLYGMMLKSTGDPNSWIAIDDSVSASLSKLDATGEEFYYVPGVAATLGPIFRDPTGLHRWQTSFMNRYVGRRRSAVSHEKLGGFYSADASAQYTGIRWLDIGFSVQNLFDRKYELIDDYPSEGRIYLVSATAHF